MVAAIPVLTYMLLRYCDYDPPQIGLRMSSFVLSLVPRPHAIKLGIGWNGVWQQDFKNWLVAPLAKSCFSRQGWSGELGMARVRGHSGIFSVTIVVHVANRRFRHNFCTLWCGCTKLASHWCGVLCSYYCR